MSATQQQTSASERNGVDVALMQQMVDVMAQHPEAGRAVVRTSHRWDDGLGVDGYAREIEQAGEVEERRHTFRSDWPVSAGGADSGPAPGESLLAALGACVTMSCVYVATARGIDLDEIEVAANAEVDLRGAMGDDSVQPGLQAVDLTLRVRADADEATITELAQTASRRSPTYDTLRRGVPIELTVEPLGRPER